MCHISHMGLPASSRSAMIHTTMARNWASSPGGSSTAWCRCSATEKCSLSTQMGRPRSSGIRWARRRCQGAGANLAAIRSQSS